MVEIKTKYIILIWIIILILFTFYCIFRLGYLREKYDDNLLQNIKATNPNIISYINSIQSKDKIIDIVGCEKMYDDNIAVRELGYNNCQNAYADYLEKNLNVDAKYGHVKSLAEICPVSSKTAEYSKCLKSLMTKFSDNSNILDTINADMNESINKRIEDRNSAISGIQTALTPFIFSKEQIDFNNNMEINGQVPQYKEDILDLVNSYYQNRYKGGYEGFNDNSNSLLNNVSTLIIDPEIEKAFFGKYQPVKGQFISLNNLTITLDYDKTNSNLYNATTSTTNTTTTTITKHESVVKIGNITEELPVDILLTIDNGNLKISYKVKYLENYKALANVIKMNLSEKTIVDDKNEMQLQEQSAIIQNLLSILGINVPSRIIMTYDEFISAENIKHRTYKIVNDNLDTILVLNKL